MDIHSAATSGCPFRHPDMIGAYAVLYKDNVPHLVHRDNIDDFHALWADLIVQCIPNDHSLFGLTCFDLLRTDWETVKI